MTDHLVRALTRDGALRVCTAATTTLVEEIRRRQQTDPTATVAIGRLASGAALMSSLLKGTQRLGLAIEGNGPLKKLQAEATADGQVRAKVNNPVAGLSPCNGRFDVAGAIGKAGFLHVCKDLGLKEPYQGMVQLYTSEIAEDLAYYFTTSEQTPSSVALGVELDQHAQVAAAGGFLLQLMPGADPALAELLEDRLNKLPPTTSLIREGMTPNGLLERILLDIPYQVLSETPLVFNCTCNKQQTGRILRMLGAKELDQLLENAGGTTVTCEYCKETYPFDRAELEQIRATLP